MHPRDGEIERALLRQPRDEARHLTLSAFQRGRAGAHIQPTLDLLLIVAMTREALLVKQRRDTANKQQLGGVIRTTGG